MDNKNTKAKVIRTYHTTEGTLYKESIVVIESQNGDLIRVKDNIGKIYYINSKDLLKL